MMKKTFFILLFLISSCGYQPIYLNKSLKNFEFKKIILIGDNYINKKIINILSIKENDEDDNKSELALSSSFQIKEISRNSKGQVELYKNIINVNLNIKDIKNETVKNKNFTREFTYNNKQNKFDLVEYQDSIKDDLIDKIISDIIIYLNSE
tara:strand:- start:110 stop:565 length:456 start_codon:yes stop_codon:yes gene_type:complete